MATETLMTRTPRSGAHRTVAHLRVPPPATPAQLPELVARFYDQHGRALGAARLEQEQIATDFPLAGVTLLRAVLAPVALDPAEAAFRRDLPSATCALAAEQSFELPYGWWEAFRPGAQRMLHGRALRPFGRDLLPLAGGRVVAHAVDPFGWIEARADAELVWLRDRLLAAYPRRLPAPFDAAGAARLRVLYRAHAEEMLPCYAATLPDDWQYAEPVAAYRIQADGRFSGAIGGDAVGAHLWFTVAQEHEGAEILLHAPPIGAGTRWNWRGGEIALYVRHPRALCREEAQCGSATAPLVAAAPQPCGGRLHLLLDADRRELAAAGAHWYRCSWRPGHAATAAEETGGWWPLAAPAASLAPAAGELPSALAQLDGVRRIPDPALEVLVRSPEDRCWAIWDSAEACGPCTVRIDFYGADGAALASGLPPLRLRAAEAIGGGHGRYLHLDVDPDAPPR